MKSAGFEIGSKEIVTLAMVALLAYLFIKSEAKAAAVAVGEAVNPVSPNNLAYKGVTAMGTVFTGNKDFTLGGWIYDLTHDEYDPNK